MSSLKISAPALRQASWTCRACLRRQAARPLRNGLATSATRRSSVPKPARRRRVWMLSVGGLAVATAATTLSDDAQHVWSAARRTGRVVATLFVCLNDYRQTLGHKHASEQDHDASLRACHQRCAERTLATMERNGSIFIKLGQHLTSLNYLLPSEWCDTFIPLQDKCPVSSFESIEDMVLQDTGRSLSEYFLSFEKEPIGAASLAQVHRAVDRETGQKVAVKVQHPTLDKWVGLDLGLTRFTFGVIKRWFPEYDLTWLSEEMEASLPKELDFNHEARNAMRIRDYFGRVRNTPVVIPRVFWAQRRILVMEYVSGHRPDDLEYLDSHGIDRDEVSAALARIFNEMIFGTGAPLHCDCHGGNLAIRHNASRRKNKFDVIIYDHGLYRDLPTSLRRSYAKLWLAVLDADEPKMRTYAGEVAGISDDDFSLFASAITGRDYSVVKQNVAVPRSEAEKDQMSNAMGTAMLAQLVQLLGQVPRIILLILKTNDLTRALNEKLQTRQGPARTFFILARYASRTVYEEQLERLRQAGSLLWPGNLLAFVQAWSAHMRVELKLSAYVSYVQLRALLGLQPVV